MPHYLSNPSSTPSPMPPLTPMPTPSLLAALPLHQDLQLGLSKSGDAPPPHPSNLMPCTPPSHYSMHRHAHYSPVYNDKNMPDSKLPGTCIASRPFPSPPAPTLTMADQVATTTLQLHVLRQSNSQQESWMLTCSSMHVHKMTA
jgi:hypothetical protein